MSAPNTGALLMRIYGDAANPLPSETTLAKDLDFDTRHKTGESYNFPVRLGLEGGFTFASDHGVSTLNAALDGTYQPATLDGAEIIGRAQLSYGEMSKLSESKGRSAKAYDQGVGLKIANLMDGAELVRDAQLLYGCGATRLANLGVISAIAVAASSGVVTVNITRASWMAGFWQMANGFAFDVYSSGGSRRSSTQALKVTAVDPSRCRIQFTGATADAAAIVATDQIFFYNAATTSMVGLQAICENTGSLFGISAATYPQWKALQYAVNGPLNFDAVAAGLTAAAENGATEGHTLYLNPRTWTDLMTDEVALRRYAGEKASRKASPGFSELEFTLNTGTLKIKSYRYMKQGICFALPNNEVKRIGSTDLTFTLPGNPNEFFFKELDQSSGSEIRIYSDQAVICTAPYHMVEFTGVSNTGDATPA